MLTDAGVASRMQFLHELFVLQHSILLNKKSLGQQPSLYTTVQYLAEHCLPVYA